MGDGLVNVSPAPQNTSRHSTAIKTYVYINTYVTVVKIKYRGGHVFVFVRDLPAATTTTTTMTAARDSPIGSREDGGLKVLLQVRYEDEDEDEGPQPDATLEQGAPLPVRLVGTFPPELASVPLEDIDPYYRNQKVSTPEVRFVNYKPRSAD